MILKGTKEIKPLNTYVFVKEIEVNPYITRKTESGIILADTGLRLSQETGEQEFMDQLIRFGVVIEVGSDVKTLQVNDEVYFDTRTARPIPIGDHGVRLIGEQNILAYVRGEGDYIKEAEDFEKSLAVSK